MNIYEPSAMTNTASEALDKHASPFTSEEAENLAGMVANRRALFEKNKINLKKTHVPAQTKNLTQFSKNSSRKVNTDQLTIPGRTINTFVVDTFGIKRCESDKENRLQCEGQASLKNINSNKNDRSSNTMPLWSMSEETSKELYIPLSVKQAKLCFEKTLEMPSLIAAKRNEKNSNVPNRAYRTESVVLPENNSLKAKPQQESFQSISSASPDIINSLSSTSTSSSISSSNSIESGTRLGHNTNYYPLVLQPTHIQFQNHKNSSNPDNETMMTVEIKSQIKCKSNNIANKIKKLESKFSRCEEQVTNNQQIGSTRFKTTLPTLANESFISNNSSSNKFSHQSPKFLQLFQKQMDINNSNKNSKNLGSEEADTLTNNSELIPGTNNLRKMTSSSSIGSSTSSASSTNENELTETTKTLKVDNAPCVLPSILRSGRQNYTPSDVTQKAFNKLENTPMFNTPAWKPATNTAKQTTRSSYAQPGGFVKNNAAIFNRNSDPLGAHGFKKVKTSACTAREALIRWCRNRTVDYDNVSIENFSSSWSNGLAFCALLHHFMPDAFDYEALSDIDPRHNFELAFKIAEDKAGIVSLLDVDDMIEMGNSPDWKCVFTYVHSIYQRFKETS